MSDLPIKRAAKKRRQTNKRREMKMPSALYVTDIDNDGNIRELIVFNNRDCYQRRDIPTYLDAFG